MRRHVGELFEFGVGPPEFVGLLVERCLCGSRSVEFGHDALAHVLDVNRHRPDVLGALRNDAFVEAAFGDPPARRGECLQRVYDGAAHPRRKQDRGDEERHDHRGEDAVAPVPDLVELGHRGIARVIEAIVLSLEKGSQTVEFSPPTLNRAARDERGPAWRDARDQRLGVRASPACRGLLDRVEIGDERFAARQIGANTVGGSIFRTFPVAVGGQELVVGGDGVAPHGRFLVAQRGLQLVGGHPGGLDVVGQIGGHTVGPVQHDRAGHRTCDDDQTHGSQHQVEPPLHGQPHRDDRSTRITAMSSVRPPCGSA